MATEIFEMLVVAIIYILYFIGVWMFTSYSLAKTGH